MAAATLIRLRTIAASSLLAAAVIASTSAPTGATEPIAAAQRQVASNAPAHPTAHCRPIFTRKFKAALARQFPTQRVTASIEDVRDGCNFHLHSTMRITTASVIKAQVLGAVLLKAQAEHRSLDTRERHDIHPMIHDSFNNPYVPDLYNDVGGIGGMDRFDRRMHAFHTSNTEEYGATVTTSNDRTNIVRRMLYGGGPMHAAYRKVAWHYMSHVTPTQRWGITTGMRHGWNVALKNGFYPLGSGNWRVGSTGFLRAPGSDRGYAITIMTDNDVTQADGMRLVQDVARRAAERLAHGPLAKRIVSRARCLTVRGGTSWEAVAARLGTRDWKGVRRVSGGNPDPLFGQRVCSPTLRSS